MDLAAMDFLRVTWEDSMELEGELVETTEVLEDPMEEMVAEEALQREVEEDKEITTKI